MLLISGVAEKLMVVQGLQLSIAGFFGKPFDTQALLHRILELIGPNGPAKDRASTLQRDYRTGFTGFQPIFTDL